MSLREKLHCYGLSRIETLIEKCTRSDVHSVKEKHVVQILSMFQTTPSSTQDAFVKRYKQKFTRKQFSHYLYIVLRVLITEHNPVLASGFVSFTAPFETLCESIEEDNNTSFHLALSRYIDHSIVLSDRDRRIDPNFRWSITFDVKYQLNYFHFFHSLLEMVNTITSFNFETAEIYLTYASLDLVELCTSHLSIIYYMLLMAMRETMNGFLGISDCSVIDQMKKCVIKFEQLVRCIRKVYSSNMLKFYFKDLPLIHLMDFFSFVELLDLRREITSGQSKPFPFDQCGVVITDSIKEIDNDVNTFKSHITYDGSSRGSTLVFSSPMKSPRGLSKQSAFSSPVTLSSTPRSKHNSIKLSHGYSPSCSFSTPQPSTSKRKRISSLSVPKESSFPKMNEQSHSCSRSTSFSSPSKGGKKTPISHLIGVRDHNEIDKSKKSPTSKPLVVTTSAPTIE
ncbi:hypothetical protein QTN25_007121 [Entamoeba marina]